MEQKARLRVKCSYCGSTYSVVVLELPLMRVKRNHCFFCGERVHPVRESMNQTIDTFLNNRAK